MRTLVLNGTNIVSGTNNSTLIYNFPSSVDLTGCEIAVSNLTMYYSWDNINSSPLANNTFSYQWVVAGVPTTFTITIPNGLYEIADINALLQFTFIQNGHYLVNASGSYVYYAQLVINPTAYAVELDTFAVPTSLPSGWTNPASLALPATTFNPNVSFPANFNQIVGFVAGFSSGLNTGIGTTLSFLSTITPQVQPNSSLLIAISGIDNKYSNPSTIIYSVAPNVSLGELIVEKPAQFNFNKLLSGQYNQLRLQFLGSNLSPIQIRDPNMTIILIIKDQDDLYMDSGAGNGSSTAQSQIRSGAKLVGQGISGVGRRF